MPVSPDQFWLAMVDFFRQELDRRLMAADVSYLTATDPAFVRIEIPTKLGTGEHLVAQATKIVATEFMKAGWEHVSFEVSYDKVVFLLRVAPDSLHKA